MLLKRVKEIAIVVILLTGAVLSGTGHLEKAASFVGGETVSNYNEQYLDDSFNKSLKGFLILSGIKSGLAVIEGSEIGVGFNLEIGDIVQSVYDYVDIAWRTALVGGTIILITQLALQVISLINQWCLGLLFCLILLIYLFEKFKKTDNPVFLVAKSALTFTAVLTIALYLILPVSIRGASFISKKITNPLIEEAQAGFLSVKKDLSADSLSSRLFENNRPGEDDSWMEKFNLQAHYKNTKQNLLHLGLYLKKQTEFIAVWTIKLIAGYLFDCLLFPIIFFSFLYLFVKFTLHNLLGMRIFGNYSKQ